MREQIVTVQVSYANKLLKHQAYALTKVWIRAETNFNRTRLAWEQFLSVLGLCGNNFESD
jgi:hypothetical protein